MRVYKVFAKVKETGTITEKVKVAEESCHFDEDAAKEAVLRISYTDKAGAKHEGAHWTPEQLEAATASMKFPEGTTKWDKWMAFNSFYADLCKVLDESSILKAAYAFYFADEDAPAGKIKKYIRAMGDEKEQ